MVQGRGVGRTEEVPWVESENPRSCSTSQTGSGVVGQRTVESIGRPLVVPGVEGLSVPLGVALRFPLPSGSPGTRMTPTTEGCPLCLHVPFGSLGLRWSRCPSARIHPP